jgi:hypothetical protein
VKHPNAQITALIRQAEAVTLEQFSGQPLTLGPQGTIARLGNVIRHILLTQVALGLWDDVIPFPEGESKVEYSGFAELSVEFRLGSPARNEPPLVADYNFSKTRLALLQVKHAAAGSEG